jgi:hypothetical protein
MAQIPTVLGLLVCEKVVIEERTHNVTLVNCFTRRNVEAFPSERQRFAVFAALTDGLGDIELKLVVQRLDTQEEIYQEARRVQFADRLQEVRFLFRVTTCTFPVAGPYDLILLADGSELARHRIHVA